MPCHKTPSYRMFCSISNYESRGNTEHMLFKGSWYREIFVLISCVICATLNVWFVKMQSDMTIHTKMSNRKGLLRSFFPQIWTFHCSRWSSLAIRKVRGLQVFKLVFNLTCLSIMRFCPRLSHFLFSTKPKWIIKLILSSLCLDLIKRSCTVQASFLLSPSLSMSSITSV